MKVSLRTPARFVAAGILLLLAAILLLAPPAPIRLDPRDWRDLAARTVAVAYHVHSARSDGALDKASIASAASRAGMQVLILTDHGDGTRPPDPPAYIDRVLCLDAVEISTDQGHYIALDMPRSPYPLGGAAESVVEDVRRLGGFGIAAHADSPKTALRWTDESARIDGIEWLNADSEWRNERRGALARAAFGYLVRPAAALATLLDRPSTLDRWDRLTAGSRIVALAGVDAHGGIGQRLEDGSRSNFPGIPGYETSFRTFSNRAVLERPLTGEASVDARALFGAIRAGRVFTTIDALAGPGLIDFRAEPRCTMGCSGPGGADATLVARALTPPGAEIVLFEGGRERARSSTEVRYRATAARGAYRVEVHTPRAPGDPPIPWLVSNPIFFGVPEMAPGNTPADSLANGRPVATIPPPAWRIEKDAGSSAILRSGPGRVELEYSLKQGSRESQYVAIAADLPHRAFDALRFELAADRPARIFVQVRRADGSRWGRSVYVDRAPRTIDVRLSKLRPIGQAAPAEPDAGALGSVLLVVDLTNAGPGQSGRLWVRNADLVN